LINILKLKTWLKVAVVVQCLFLAVGCSSTDQKGASNADVYISMSTEYGDIEIQLYARKAPISVTNFLRYVDAGDFEGRTFYRVVRADNDNGSPQIAVIQGDVKNRDKEWPAIRLETTEQTGIKHLDGTLSMARGAPDTATSVFFICVGAQPSLDFGGMRNTDGQGFAAFGRVIKGMDVVRKINDIRLVKGVDDDYMKGQMLAKPVVIERVKRK
jgi:peptidyl-prolyl cis-trans isomerase A (cyclophilin A)